MRRRKRQMPARMPILREHDVREFGRQGIYHRHNFMAVRHGEAAAGTEVVLDVDNEKRIALADSQFFFQARSFRFPPPRGRCVTMASTTSTGSVLSGSSSCSGCFQAPK